MTDLFPFRGIIQHYAWGGYDYLPNFLHRSNSDHQPWAELWMGAHPKGPGRVIDSDKNLQEVVENDPVGILGAEVAAAFDDKLPFLFKILDVREMLSIQVHPTKSAAEAGFAREEKDGPARDAPDRNYRDDNHKPELGLALTDFYLLHGFREKVDIAATLERIPGWDSLKRVFESEGVEALYAKVMHADQQEIDTLLQPLADEVAGKEYNRDQADFWAKRAFEQYTTEQGHYDRGVFSIFWFNLVKLAPGEAIFQDAGIPHAYLEGVCIELMANSDNVLRGGLTPKHIDVPELLEKTRFDVIVPHKIEERAIDGHWNAYPTPAPDFELRVARPAAGEEISVTTPRGASILLLTSGRAKMDGLELTDERRTVFIPYGKELTLKATEDSVVYLATVGHKK